MWDCACSHGMMAQVAGPDVTTRSQIVWGLKVGIAAIVFWLSVSAIPIYNKLVFATGVCDGKACLRKYPFPMATAFLQLALVSLTLCIANAFGHFWRLDPSESWILGPHSKYKLRHVGPVGVLFGLKYGFTNWGLQMVPVSTLAGTESPLGRLGMHLLLQSTDIIWTILLAEYANGEELGLVEVLAAVLSGTGSFVIGLYAVDTLDAPVLALLATCFKQCFGAFGPFGMFLLPLSPFCRL